ncbi:MAG: VOC family protein [Candidatus Binataceae bacterium]|nr:VOC family protein [Candidatus Binataceae bacterium]
MLQPRQLGYLALDVADLESSVRFYQDVVHLDVTEEREGCAYLTGGIQHHWLVLRQSTTPGVNRVAFEMENERDLEAMEKRLKAAGVEVERAGSGTLGRERVDQYIRFRDPDGIMIELFTDMVTMPMAPTYAHRVHMSKLLHTVLLEKDASKSVPFYTDLLGFQISDWVERTAAFMRCGDKYHHSIGVFGTGGTRTQVDHMCILVPTLDDLMRARANVMALNVPFRNDLLKHAPSGSIAIYFRDEANNLTVEYCWEHGQILDEAHRPRVLPAMPETLDMWRLVGPGFGKGTAEISLSQGVQPLSQPAASRINGGAHPMGEAQALSALGVRQGDGARVETGK